MNPPAVNQTFNFTGGVQQYVVPAGVFSLQIDTWGAQGGNGSWGGPCGTGGRGGFASGTLAVTPGQVLNIYVGGQGDSQFAVDANNPGGFNGGGNGGFDNFPQVANGGGGGGASDVRVGGVGLANRVIVAAGGGGAACNANGGAGGGLTGSDGVGFSGSIGGGGGTQVSGGLAGLLTRGATMVPLAKVARVVLL